MFAQSLGEYGGASGQGQVPPGLQRFTDSIRDWVSDAGPTTWLVVGGIVIAALWYVSRRPSR